MLCHERPILQKNLNRNNNMRWIRSDGIVLELQVFWTQRVENCSNSKLQRKHYSPVYVLCRRPTIAWKHVRVAAIQICRRTQQTEYSDQWVSAVASQAAVLQMSPWCHYSAVQNIHKLYMLIPILAMQQNEAIIS